MSNRDRNAIGRIAGVLVVALGAAFGASAAHAPAGKVNGSYSWMR